MENPQTPETLEAQNSGGKTLEVASGFLDWSESCTGLDELFTNNLQDNGKRVDFGHNDVGLGNVGVTSQVGADATVSGVASSCLNDGVLVIVEGETQVVKPEERNVDGAKGEDLGSGVDAAVSGVQESFGNGVVVEEGSVELQRDGDVDAKDDSKSEEGGVMKTVDGDGTHEDRTLGSIMDGSPREDGVEKAVDADVIGKDKAVSSSMGVSQREDDGDVKMREEGAVEKKLEDSGIEKSVDEDGTTEEKALGSRVGGSQIEGDEVEKMVGDDGIAERKAGSNGIDSACDKLQESGDGISLFVDLTGPPPGFIADMGSSPGFASKKDEEEFGDDEQEKGDGDCVYDFSVGDIVWVKTKIKTWWPGKIHNPADAPKYRMFGDLEGCLLVGYFGMGHVAWCHPFQLKPFPQYFEQISGQSKARIFVGAVEKALEEFGGRVKLNMTCACALKENRLSVGDAASKEGIPVPDYTSHELGDFAVPCFDTENFLAKLKNLAQVVSKVGILDFTVIQNQLSAFYSSIGHSQLPMHLLQDRIDAEGDVDETVQTQTEENALRQEKNEVSRDVLGGDNAYKIPKSKKRKMKRESEIEETTLSGDGGNDGMVDMGSELRERKKSRYLSYPYVNWEKKGLSAEGMAESIDGGPPANFKSTGEKFWRKWYRSFTGEGDISGNSSLKNITSAELLSEFCSAATDCQYPLENKAFNTVAWIISNFRISVFLEEPICETYNKNIAVQDDAEDAELCQLETSGQNEAKSEPKKRNKKAVLKQSEGEDATNMPNSVQSPATSVQGVNGSLGKKRGRPKLSKCKTKSLSGMSDVKVEQASQANLHTAQTVGIPDLNGNIVLPTVLVGDQHVISIAPSEGVTPLDTRLGTEAASESKSNVAAGLVDVNGNTLQPGTLVVDLGMPAQAWPCLDFKQVTGLLLTESKPAPKKRKRKQKGEAKDEADGIPDLNGNGAECLTPPTKPERKRRRKKGESQATGLLLTFAPGFPMPSKDDLIATFCRFGPLKESETQLLLDTASAQVVFMESADAEEALPSLEKNNPFGTNLVSYKRFNLPSVSNVLATSLASPPTKKLLTPVQLPAKAPCLDVIKQNLQMMTSMLEKSGDNLSPEMRTKLENDIKSLLQKVSSTTGSSSS